MADFNLLTITGRLTKNATIERVGSKGTSIAKFSVANNTGYGEYAKVSFFDCEMWGKMAESLHQYLVKGKQVLVSGVLVENAWEYNGQKYKKFVLTVKELTLLGGGDGAKPQEKPSSDGASPQNTGEDYDFPF